jgi:hypothetical protein
VKAFLVFAAVALADGLWTRYIRAASDGRRWPAANYSAAIIAVGAFTTIAYIDDPRYLLPACLGAWAGTWFSVRG